MTKERKEKPILFNPEMIKAILDGRKGTTRRVIKLKYDNTHHEIKTDKYGTRLIEIENEVEGETYGRNQDGTTWHRLRFYIEPQPLYKKGDILYVRETWAPVFPNKESNDIVGYMYKVDSLEGFDHRFPEGKEYQWEGKWRPSIHMPKKAARIWLRVTDVKVERLQDITEEQAIKEGCINTIGLIRSPEDEYAVPPHSAKEEFKNVWDAIISKRDLPTYGWDANPYVWVIEFERLDSDSEKILAEKMRYKLRIYHTDGPEKGNLKKEEFFDTIQELNSRYEKLFQRSVYSLRPTAWENKGDKWKRLRGY